MKTKKIVVYGLLAAIMMLGLALTACGGGAGSGPGGGGTPGLAYELINNGTAYRVRKGTVTSGAVVIPATYNGLPVTEIGSTSDNWGNGAFLETDITSVTIPASVTSIGSSAFRECNSLTSVTIPVNVTFGGSVFRNCAGLTSVTISAGVTSISDKMFEDCVSLTSITIPDSVMSVGDEVFSGCENLTSITIPASVTSIGIAAFIGCTSLTGITVDANNPNYTSQNGILYNKNKTELISYPSASGSVTIPADIMSIGRYAFCMCTGLISITIPNSVISIGGAAFAGCTSLTSMTIPASVTSIGNSAFAECTGLTVITVDNNNQYYASEGGILYNREKTEFISVPLGITNVTIPASITSIGNDAFYDCTSLISITIPNSVTSIGQSAFSGCTSIISITIPESVTSIDREAFSGCTGLTNVTISSGVTSIGGWAFYYCTGLTSVTFAVGSDISDDNFGYDAFPGVTYGPGYVSYGNTDTLRTAYLRTSEPIGGAGTYKRAVDGDDWMKE